MFRDLHQHAKFMITVVYSQTQFIRTLRGTLERVVYVLSGCP